MAKTEIERIVRQAARVDRPAGSFLIRAGHLEPEQIMTLRRRLLGAGVWTGVLEAGRLDGPTGLVQALAKAFHFPGYFGRNWDAVVDCLSDLSWIAVDRACCLVREADAYRAKDGPGFRMFLEACRSVAQRLAEQGRPGAFSLILA